MLQCVLRVRPECLAKRWPRKMATVKAGSRKQITLSRVLGEQRMDIIGMLGKGAYAVVFSCKIDGDQRNLAVKIEHEVSTYSLGWSSLGMFSRRGANVAGISNEVGLKNI